MFQEKYENSFYLQRFLHTNKNTIEFGSSKVYLRDNENFMRVPYIRYLGTLKNPRLTWPNSTSIYNDGIIKRSYLFVCTKRQKSTTDLFSFTKKNGPHKMCPKRVYFQEFVTSCFNPILLIIITLCRPHKTLNFLSCNQALWKKKKRTSFDDLVSGTFDDLTGFHWIWVFVNSQSNNAFCDWGLACFGKCTSSL